MELSCGGLIYGVGMKLFKEWGKLTVKRILVLLKFNQG